MSFKMTNTLFRLHSSINGRVGQTAYSIMFALIIVDSLVTRKWPKSGQMSLSKNISISNKMSLKCASRRSIDDTANTGMVKDNAPNRHPPLFISSQRSVIDTNMGIVPWYANTPYWPMTGNLHGMPQKGRRRWNNSQHFSAFESTEKWNHIWINTRVPFC